MMYRYAHLLRPTSSGVRTGAVVAVPSGQCEVKGGLISFVIFTFILLERRRMGFEAVVLK
jgi:hypothetical protein